MGFRKYLLPANALILLVLILGFAAFAGALVLSAAPTSDDYSQAEEPASDLLTTIAADPEADPVGEAGILEDAISSPELADLNYVYLITSDVLEIEYDAPVTAAEAEALFTIEVDGEEVEWEFLSYFDFGEYAYRGGVVNVRLTEPLDVGEPRGRIRSSTANTFLNETQSAKGPVAAERITVTVGAETETAEWNAFYTERSLGYMSRMWVWGAAKAGNNGVQTEMQNVERPALRIKLVEFLSENDFADDITPDTVFNDTNDPDRIMRDNKDYIDYAAIGAFTANNEFSATAEPKYTDEYITRQVAEGINRLCGRSEYLNLPMVDAGGGIGFKALMLGPEQSVYEAPEYRELYKYGETDDTYERPSIKASDVPGNFVDGDYLKPYIVGTGDDVMRHYSPLKADGSPATGDADSARPRTDLFHLGEAFFDMYYHLGLIEGCKRFPLSPFNDPGDYRYDIDLEEAWENAKAEDLWPGTDMIKTQKDYYIYGALIFFEMIPESQGFLAKTFPINTRAELCEYDHLLYRAIAGTHGKYEYWTGTGNGQDINASNDNGKYNIPWFWHNQPDNFGLPSADDPTKGEEYEPLKVAKVQIVDGNRLDVVFNREVKTVAPLTQGANWRIYINGKQITNAADDAPANPTSSNGYNWKRIRLDTNYNYNWSTGAETNIHNRLDNGKPYGARFSGFSENDLEERSIANGGWIANNQELGRYPLEFGQYVGLQDAIDIYGAGPAGKVEVEYIGTAEILDWAGNKLEPNVKYEAEFLPWMGNAYRTPLTGVYIYTDTAIDDVYGAEIVSMAAAQTYENHLLNNKKETFPNSAGGDAFMNAFPGGEYVYSGQTLTNGPVTYDRVGQRIADGAVRGGGGMMIAAGSVFGNHPGMQPRRNNLSGNISDSLRVEGWGGMVFQTEDVLVMRDYNLCRYKNENLALHEGGHGIDSFAPAYAQNIYNDISAAWATATNAANGARWRDVDNVVAYCGSRGEYTSTLPTFYAGAMRESFQGINDGTWTPICTREELFRYDPYGFEVFNRIFFVGELGLWYNNKVGDPAYRVIPEDWKLLKDTYPEFKDWTGVNNLIAWGASTPEISNNNPYTGQTNDAVKWVSWRIPNVWDITPYKEPNNPAYPNNRFDFVGRSAYNPDPVVGSPTINQEHPFFRPGGVPKPERPAELEALVTPVPCIITDDNATILSRPVLIQFELECCAAEITSNNAPTTFKMTIDGDLTHFYFWSFEIDDNTGAITVTLRLDWPVEEDAVIIVTEVETADPVEVTLNANGGKVDGKLSMTKDFAVGGKYIGLPIPTRADYSFIGWFTEVTGGTKVTAETVVTKDSAHTLYAQWETTTFYTVKFDSKGGSSINDLTVPINGTAAKPTDPTRSGYKFVGWYTDDACTIEYNFATAVTKNITLYAKWESSGGSGGSSGDIITGPLKPSLRNILGNDTQGATFTDVPASHWAYQYVEYLARKGFVTGKSATRYAPNDSITRAEFVTILARMEGAALSSYSGPFTDVVSGSYYAGAVDWAVKAGVTIGTSATTFSPNRTISRQEIATMLARYVTYKLVTLVAYNQPLSFTDEARIAAYAKDYVKNMQISDVINGYPDGSFKPLSNASRAEAAKMLALVHYLMSNR